MQDDDLSRRKGRSLAERIAGRINVNGPMPSEPSPRPALTAATPSAPTNAGQPPTAPLRKEKPAATKAPVQPSPNAAPDATTTPDEVYEPDLVINFKRLQAAGIITPNSVRTDTTEEFRVIKRQLMKATFNEDGKVRGHNGNVIMVTSSIPHEGKSFISLNLAMSLSMERDLYVLLVDGDNHRHGLSTMLEAEKTKVGLVDLLFDKSLRMRDIIQRTNVPNLSVIPAGQPHPQAAEFMASKGMVNLMDDLAQRYPDRLIIIDTPPVLASTEGVVLSSHVGHVIVVVEKDYTSKRQLRRSLEMLDGCENISCILNMETSDQRFTEYAYGY